MKATSNSQTEFKATNVLYLGLSCFHQTGGIEKVNKIWLKTLNDLADRKEIKLKAFVLLDTLPDEKYIKSSYFKGFKNKKISYFLNSMIAASKADVLVVSHIHLWLIVALVKVINPKLKTYIHAHGIEIWGNLHFLKLKTLAKSTKIFAVSNFTKQQLLQNQNITPALIDVWPNALDPYFDIPKEFNKSEDLTKRYQIKNNDQVLFTLARLSSQEQYKGYDDVIRILPQLLKTQPKVKYLIGGKYDDLEYQRLTQIIKNLNLEETVKLLGFIKDEELTAHYVLANAFVMPSKGEGFGITFIEASACGTPVLAADADGSKQAVLENKTGLICKYGDAEDLTLKINELLNFNYKAQEIQAETLRNYSFENYKNKIQELIL